MKKLFFFVIIFVQTTTLAQLSIDFPFERAVYQRNASNQANVNIVGTTSEIVSQVEVRISGVSNGFVVINWQVIDAAPINGVFRGVVANLAAGWYKAEVRGLKLDNTYTSIATVFKFGVGEVFVIAGQSNAQGVDLSYGAAGSADDRVNTVNFNDFCEIRTPSFPVYSQVNSSTSLAYHASTPWAYGKLGELISSNVDVPVLFFNAAASGSSITNWYDSMLGFPTVHLYTCGQYCNKIGAPYGILKEILNYYIPNLGIRAILWHQGEGDNFPSSCGPSLPSTADYKAKLLAIINQSRVELGSNVPWMIARASYIPSNNDPFPADDYNPADDYVDPLTLTTWKGTRQAVVDGQNAIINDTSIPNIFPGPYTDNIPRDVNFDRLHFSNTASIDGLNQLGIQWYYSVIFSGLLNSTAQVIGNTIKPLDVSCNNGNLAASTEAGFSEYVWVEDNNNITSPFNAINSNVNTNLLPNKTYRVYMKNANGKTFISNKISLPATPNASTPTVNPPTSLISTVGSTISLTATGCDGIVSWEINNGSSIVTTSTTTNTNPLNYTINSQTSFVAKCTKYQNCTSINSNLITISVCPTNQTINFALGSGIVKYEASNTVTGNKVISKVINQTTNVTFDAGKAVILQPGFEVQVGGVFLARIDGCGNN